MIVTGHRGALGSEPENTLRSFRRAVADGCELDLRVTADGEPVGSCTMQEPTAPRTATDRRPRCTSPTSALSMPASARSSRPGQRRSRLSRCASRRRSRPWRRPPCWRSR
ncbi:glycerophosphodiester phosphodiesterase [Kribbella qitaiheensis]|uniref:glycerophosphodiester phosphodiesterase n=1 Tax=Kribbella qitaiheensis TaxID=1544730 RepID=UPI001FE813B5|nr:glycerophosphodiester phosphodiesterase [Kribbella qitaiheensis]